MKPSKSKPVIVSKSIIPAAPKAIVQKFSDLVRNHTIALEQITGALQATTPEQYDTAAKFTKGLTAVAKVLDIFIKNRIIDFVTENGGVSTDKGGMWAKAGEDTLRIRPWRTGVDAKKLESLLRRKGIPLEKCMDARVSYAFNEFKTNEAVNKGDLTQAEVETCWYDEKWVALSGTKDDGDSGDDA